MKNPILLLFLLFFLSTACRYEKKKETTLAPIKAEPLCIGMMPTLDGLPFLIAKNQGIYDSLGLDLTILQFNSSNDRNAAFQTGQIDGMITDYLSAGVLAPRKKLSFIMKNESYFCFIVSKESRIKYLKDLQQKNIAIAQNTVIEYATEQLLNKANLKVSDINQPEIGVIPLRLQMMQYGQIDASFLPDPSASIAMNDGFKSLISTKELGINFTGTAFSKKALTEQKEEIKLLIKGYNYGVEFIQKYPLKKWKQALIEIGVPDNLTGLIVLPPYQPATRPSEKDIKEAITWLKKNKRVSNSYLEENLIDTTFIQSKQPI